MLAVVFALGCGGGTEEEAPLSFGSIAYVQGGDLWVKELPAASAKRLTTDGRNRRPRWSRSGGWVAFLKDDQLKVVQPSTGRVDVLNGGGAVTTFGWSPRGDTLAFLTAAGGVRLAAPPSWGERSVATGAVTTRAGAVGLVWSPDADWLAIGRHAGASGTSGASGEAAELWRLRVEGRDSERLFSPPRGSDASEGTTVLPATWPDEGRILFWSGAGSASLLADGASLQSISADGGDPKEIVRSMLVYADFVAPSPDGEHVAVARGAGRETWSTKRLVLVDMGSGEARGLSADSVAAISPDWSPDGEYVAYVAAPDEGFLGVSERARAVVAQRKVWVIGRNGSGNRRLTDDSRYRDERPLWSAGGTHLLFARLAEDGRASLWLLDVATGVPQQVVEDVSPAPEWSGTYGHIDWGEHFDWWRGGASAEE